MSKSFDNPASIDPEKFSSVDFLLPISIIIIHVNEMKTIGSGSLVLVCVSLLLRAIPDMIVGNLSEKSCAWRTVYNLLDLQLRMGRRSDRARGKREDGFHVQAEDCIRR